LQVEPKGRREEKKNKGKLRRLMSAEDDFVPIYDDEESESKESEEVSAESTSTHGGSSRDEAGEDELVDVEEEDEDEESARGLLLLF